MDEENNIYKTWIAQDKKFYDNEQDMYFAAIHSNKLTIFDHFSEKYIVFDTLDAFWEMLNDTPKEYTCYSEVVFNEHPQSPVIELSFHSNGQYPGSKLVNTLNTVLDTMLKIFNEEYNDTFLAQVPSSLDDLVVMDEIVQHGDAWSYYFHIHTPAFYLPSYYHSVEFRKKLCNLLPEEIRSLVSCPSDYIFQLVGIFSCYSLSFDYNKRISHFTQFLKTKSSVDRNDLFTSCFSTINHISPYEQEKKHVEYDSPTTQINQHTDYIDSCIDTGGNTGIIDSMMIAPSQRSWIPLGSQSYELILSSTRLNATTNIPDNNKNEGGVIEQIEEEEPVDLRAKQMSSIGDNASESFGVQRSCEVETTEIVENVVSSSSMLISESSIEILQQPFDTNALNFYGTMNYIVVLFAAITKCSRLNKYHYPFEEKFQYSPFFPSHNNNIHRINKYSKNTKLKRKLGKKGCIPTNICTLPCEYDIRYHRYYQDKNWRLTKNLYNIFLHSHYYTIYTRGVVNDSDLLRSVCYVFQVLCTLQLIRSLIKDSFAKPIIHFDELILLFLRDVH